MRPVTHIAHAVLAKRLGRGSILLIVAAAGVLIYRSQRTQAPPPAIPLPSEAAEGLPRRVAEVLYAHREALKLTPVPELRVYVALRKGGQRIAHGFVGGATWPQAITSGIAELIERKPEAASADSVELCLPHSRRKVKLTADRSPLGEMHRGVKGIALHYKDREIVRCPTQIIADNKKFEDVIDGMRDDLGLSKAEWATAIDDARAEQFDAYQWLIELGDKPSLRRMQRGNELVKIESVDDKSIQALAQGMTDWMKHNVQPDGRMVYMYWPSRGEESSANNMIRQFMATLCLQRIANRENTEAARELAHRNLKYNLAQFYLRDGELGLIDESGKRKLGAAALAALSIVESPFRAEFAEQEMALRKLVEHLQQPDGSFLTFYGEARNDNQNFYPGEALLLWATLLDEDPKGPLAERFDRAFLYYRSWHRENRNPAFIPWHTQAYYKVWKRTHDERLRDFIFEMNDFLADFQQWDKAPYDDLRGRFYDPDRREFGPAHASSTGVYIEGLTDARMLARELGDMTRAQRYALTIKRSLRSLMQLQYVNAVDTFYISRPERVLGGIRTTEYDNAIRVDNVQHGLMGIQKLLDAIGKGHRL